jgi:D-cysteine desulfhydrase
LREHETENREQGPRSYECGRPACREQSVGATLQASGLKPQACPLALFESFPRLRESLPWLHLGHWPTPIKHSQKFAAANSLRALYIKREDLSHPHGAGNKVRGLEFLLADARQRRATTLITASSAGSHHICKSAWHARQLGMDTVAVVVHQPQAEYVRRNLLLGASVGTRYVPVNLLTALPKTALQFLVPSRWNGWTPPCWIPPGGTSPLACIGHVNAVFELKRQIDAGLLPTPEYLYVAMGSLGTAAGLAAGCALAGLKTQIVGVVVSYRWYATLGRWSRLARRTIRLLRRHDPTIPDAAIDKSSLHVVSTALGHGYAHVTVPATALARQMHDTEELELDGTYTAKMLHGAMQFIDSHHLHDRVHLLWHTYHAIPPRNDLIPFAARLPRALQRYM